MTDNSKRTGAAIEAHYQFLVWLVPTVEKFPKSHKFTIGERIQTIALDVLEALTRGDSPPVGCVLGTALLPTVRNWHSSPIRCAATALPQLRADRRVDGDVMQQCGEPYVSTLSRRLAHGCQPVRRGIPAQCPGRGRLTAAKINV